MVWTSTGVPAARAILSAVLCSMGMAYSQGALESGDRGAALFWSDLRVDALPLPKLAPVSCRATDLLRTPTLEAVRLGRIETGELLEVIAYAPGALIQRSDPHLGRDCPESSDIWLEVYGPSTGEDVGPRGFVPLTDVGIPFDPALLEGDKLRWTQSPLLTVEDCERQGIPGAAMKGPSLLNGPRASGTLAKLVDNGDLIVAYSELERFVRAKARPWIAEPADDAYLRSHPEGPGLRVRFAEPQLILMVEPERLQVRMIDVLEPIGYLSDCPPLPGRPRAVRLRIAEQGVKTLAALFWSGLPEEVSEALVETRTVSSAETGVSTVTSVTRVDLDAAGAAEIVLIERRWLLDDCDPDDEYCTDSDRRLFMIDDGGCRLVGLIEPDACGFSGY